jgi:hypothetical protein
MNHFQLPVSQVNAISILHQHKSIFSNGKHAAKALIRIIPENHFPALQQAINYSLVRKQFCRFGMGHDPGKGQLLRQATGPAGMIRMNVGGRHDPDERGWG